MTSTSHAKIMRFIGVAQPLHVLRTGLEVVKAAAATGDGTQVKLAIRQLVPEYQAQLVHSPRAALAEAVQKFSSPPMAVNLDQAGMQAAGKTANGVP